MITVNGHRLIPSIFPDKTSQIWQLPDSIMSADYLDVIWRFEEEREIIDLLSLRMVKPKSAINLHIPYLPYARQDKEPSNLSTFNLHAFARLVNLLKCEIVTAIDVHNLELTKKLIKNFGNISVDHVHFKLIQKLNPTHIVFPDSGAEHRYRVEHSSKLSFYKKRNELNGGIVEHYLLFSNRTKIKTGNTFLILDDICDGGATFISIAKKLKEYAPDIKINLFVTHGIFSKGREVLTSEGIELFTTNSLLKNKDGIEVLREIY